jgi:hypothetical protein
MSVALVVQDHIVWDLVILFISCTIYTSTTSTNTGTSHVGQGVGLIKTLQELVQQIIYLVLVQYTVVEYFTAEKTQAGILFFLSTRVLFKPTDDFHSIHCI